MYYPFYRGKQFELLSIRECAKALSKAEFTPIIEPVRDALGGLEKTLITLWEAGATSSLITNPSYGDYRNTGIDVRTLLKDAFLSGGPINSAIILKSDTDVDQALRAEAQHRHGRSIFIHAGFLEPKLLAQALGHRAGEILHVFFDDYCNKMYRRNFVGSERVLIRDGFVRRRNADYEEVEPFSDLHLTYTEEGMQGFGDFLIVGDDFSESGGPAYAVAIHLTFIDPDKDDQMFIYHFVSETKHTPTNPAGKFGEALSKLVKKLEGGKSKLVHTSALQEFCSLHERGHFPGLGQVKKLSMNHHIETLAHYFSR